MTAAGGQYGAHAIATGERLWTHKGLAPAIVASPVVSGDTVVGFGYGYDATEPFAGTLAKLDSDKDGRLSLQECGTSAWLIGIAKYIGNRDGFVVESEWNDAWAKTIAPSSLVAVALEKDAAGRISPRELWRYEKSFVAVVPSPLVLDGLVYTIKSGGILTVLNATTGAVVKMGRVGAVPASYSASPVAAEGRLYLANEDGMLAVLRAGQGVGDDRRQRDRRAALRHAGPRRGPDHRQRRQVTVLFRIALNSQRDVRSAEYSASLSATSRASPVSCVPIWLVT